MISHTDFSHLDPGQAYFALDYTVIYATQRPLYAYVPGTAGQLSPDLASGPPEISADGRVVTVHIRSGVRFSPPVNREVTAADVAYAIQRGANPNVANPYFPAYFSTIVGAASAAGGPISGMSTPDRYTIVFRLSRPVASFFVGALSLPLSAPVPPEFAGPYDATRPTRYGNYLVATGPYMLKADRNGNVLGVGYEPGRSAVLVRNPNWSMGSDYRPAYLDQININIGGNQGAADRTVLTGSHWVREDTPTPAAVRLAARAYPAQIVFTPGAGDAYVALNNSHGPFANVNARRALWAALNRAAMIQAQGGAMTASLGTHFLYPGGSGFAEAGGTAGPSVDYNRHPNGDIALARRYMKRAGYRTGTYTGRKTITVVGATGSPASVEAQIVNHTLRNLGFKTRFSLVGQPVMYGLCGAPANEIDVCPNVGWIRDFADPQTVLDPPFAGKNIVASNSSNWGQVNDPTINRAIDAAELVQVSQPRANAWAQIDRMLVAKAVAVPWSFTKQPSIESKDVAGIVQAWNQGAWDYDFTSLK